MDVNFKYLNKISSNGFTGSTGPLKTVVNLIRTNIPTADRYT